MKYLINHSIFCVIFVYALSVFAGEALAINIGTDSDKFDLKVGGSINEGYDSNITYVKDKPKADFISNLNAFFSLFYDTKLFNFSATGNIYERIYSKYTKFTNNSQDMSAALGAEFSKFDRITIRDTLSHTYEPRSFEEEFGINAGHYSYFRNRFNFEYNHDISKNLSGFLRYTNTVDDPSRSDLSNSYLNSAGGELRYFVTSTLLVLASYDFLVRTFDPGGTAYTNSCAGGARYFFTNQLYIDGRAGVDFIRSVDGTDNHSPSFSVSLGDQIDKLTTVNLGFTRQSSVSAYSQDIFNSYRISGGFTRQCTDRFRVGASAFYGNGDYGDIDISDDLFGGSASIAYDISRRLRGSITYNFSRTDSNVISREYTKNTLYLGLRADF